MLISKEDSGSSSINLNSSIQGVWVLGGASRAEWQCYQ